MFRIDRSLSFGRRWVAALVLGLLISGLVVAAPGAAQQPEPLPRDPIARSRDDGFLDSRAAGSTVGVSRRVADARLALAQGLGSQGVVDADETTGTLRFVGRLDGFLTGPSARPAEAVAMDYV